MSTTNSIDIRKIDSVEILLEPIRTSTPTPLASIKMNQKSQTGAAVTSEITTIIKTNNEIQ